MSDQRQPDHDLADRANSDLRTALRERAREVPSPQIDAHILAAARRAVGSGPQSTSKPRRWFRMIDTPFATAAVVLVSASLLLLMREQGHFDHAALKEVRQNSGAMPAVPTVAAPASSSSVTPTVGAAPSPESQEVGSAAVQGQLEDKAALDALSREKIATQRANDGTLAPTDIEGDRRVESSAKAPAAAPPPPAAAAEEAKQPAAAVSNEAAPAATGAANAVNAFPGAADEKRERGADESMLAKKKTDSIGAISSPDKDAEAERKPSPEPAAAALRDAEQPATAPTATTSATQSEKQAVARLQSNKELESTAPKLSEQEQMLQSIRKLIKDGKFSDAQLLLSRFTKIYPKEHIPADILAALKPSD